MYRCCACGKEREESSENGYLCLDNETRKKACGDGLCNECFRIASSKIAPPWEEGDICCPAEIVNPFSIPSR